jgi:hypothetical protein
MVARILLALQQIHHKATGMTDDRCPIDNSPAW